MNTKPFTAKTLAILLSFVFIYSGCKNFPGDRSVIVKETPEKYQLAITYDKDKTDTVEHYLTGFIGQDAIFTPEHPSEISITMADKTNFLVQSTPGEFKLTFDKLKNSKAALQHVKKINEDLRQILN
ncbi:hypothetical protein TH53_23120 [Pedobacter lusitanus]|uniref:Uncharacterized protein n=1 Tax=Pedobacter lusitanus TaxID=1503925 RepID=A0A0D0GKQ1_9SPHI|nr:hypothetical protein [Pedobacter lusitanus]KIO75011.1 hypothetical protein TH53_23120 [Pedobacter lusitanus]